MPISTPSNLNKPLVDFPGFSNADPDVGYDAGNYLLNKKYTKYKPNANDKELVGVKSVTGIAVASKPDDVTFGIDSTSRSDAARIYVESDSGTIYIKDLGLRANPVMRLTGEMGYIHDSHYDRDDILRDGENKFELGNNYIVTTDQVEDLADYWKKRTFGKFHTYRVEMSGCRYWYEPGEWYTLQIGTAGDTEYIDSVVQLESMDIEKSSTSLGTTTLVFREVYENWKRDSTTLTRLIASGTVFDKRSSKAGAITVGSSTTLQICDYYCDGTADDVQIQKAIDVLDGQGGGMVLLTNGTFTLASGLTGGANVRVSGSGPKTILSFTSAIDAFSDGGYNDVSIEACTIQYGGTSEISKYLINTTGARFQARNLHLNHPGCLGVSLGGSQAILTGCDLTGGKSGVSIDPSTATVFSTNTCGGFAVGEIDSATMILAWSEVENSYDGYADIGTIDSYGEITATGSPVKFDDGVVGWLNTATVAIDIRGSKIAIAYRQNDGGENARLVIGNYSGGVLSFGTPSTWWSGTRSTNYVKWIDDDRVVLFGVDIDSPYTAEARIANISGTTVSDYGTQIEIDGNAMYGGVEVLDTTRIFFAYIDLTDNNPAAVICTYSDDTLTVAESEQDIGSNRNNYLSVAKSDVGRICTLRDPNTPTEDAGAVFSVVDIASDNTITYAEHWISAACDEVQLSSLGTNRFGAMYETSVGTVAAKVVGVYGQDFLIESDYVEISTGTSFFTAANGSLFAYRDSSDQAAVVNFNFRYPLSVSISSSGNNNTIAQNKIYGTADKFIECGIFSGGSGDIITNNQIVGEDNERILYGIVTDDDCLETQVLGNNIRNVSETALVIQGTRVKVSDMMCADNGDLIDRGNCESNVAPMIQGEVTPNLYNSTWARSDEQAYDGTYSYKLTVTSGGDWCHASLTDSVSGTTDMHGLVAGKTYRLNGRIYIPSTGGPAYDEVIIGWREYYSASWNSTDISAVDTTDAWQLLTEDIEINADATGIYIIVRIANTAASSEYIYVDNIQLIPLGLHNLHETQFKDLGSGTMTR